MANYCGNCGIHITPNMKYCGECGCKLDQIPTNNPNMLSQTYSFPDNPMASYVFRNRYNEKKGLPFPFFMFGFII